MEIIIKKVHAPKDLIISSIILIAGIALFFVSKGVGCFLLVCGIASLLLYKSGYKKEGDSVLLCKKSLELCGNCRPSLLDFLNGKHNNPEIVPGNEGGTVLLEIWYNKKNHVAYTQLSEFRELSFQKLTDIVELSSDDTNKILERV